MYKYYFYMLGIVDKLNEWNDKLDKLASKYMDNVVSGTVIGGIIIVVSFWAVAELTKKN